jgi:glycosyltransferase involved in cell wall biosynthesis
MGDVTILPNIDISIIMPVFNSAETLDRCIHAIQSQSFEKYELLICDDGSTDGSTNVCKKIAANDERIRVIELSHGGVSRARNEGLKRVGGEYIAFADSDDLPEFDWLSSLWKHAHPAGLSVCGYTVRDQEGVTLHGTERLGNDESCPEVTPHQFIEDIFSNRLMYQGYIWNKLFSRMVIEKQMPLRFNESIHYNEDRLFLFHYVQRCSRIYVSSVSKYNYYQKPANTRYRPEMLSELCAFEIMSTELAHPDFKSARFYANKDQFRAAATLLYLAKSANATEDLARIGEQVLRHQSYSPCFDDYPPAEQELFANAILEARKVLPGQSLTK